MLPVNRFEVDVFHHPQDVVGCVFSDYIGDPLYDPLFDADCCEAEDVLSVGLVMDVAVVCDF